MPRVPGMNHHQTQFLRALVRNPAGPPADQWPRPTILRRWLRRPKFRVALRSLLDTLRFQSDLRLTYAADTAAQHLQGSLMPSASDAQASAPASTSGSSSTSAHQLARDLLKLSHTRQRFAPPIPVPERPIDDAYDFLKHLHPEVKLGEALDYYRTQCLDDPEQLTNGQLTKP